MEKELEKKIDKGSTAGKIKKLHKQYNKILVDLFDKYAAESIEEALDSVQGSFGENIHDIIQTAADNLKARVCSELGVEHQTAVVAGPVGISFGIGDEGEDMENPEHEAEETPEEEAEEQITGIEDEEEDTETKEDEEEKDEKDEDED